jgi:hypothetical protein
MKAEADGRAHPECACWHEPESHVEGLVAQHHDWQPSRVWIGAGGGQDMFRDCGANAAVLVCRVHGDRRES